MGRDRFDQLSLPGGDAETGWRRRRHRQRDSWFTLVAAAFVDLWFADRDRGWRLSFGSRQGADGRRGPFHRGHVDGHSVDRHRRVCLRDSGVADETLFGVFRWCRAGADHDPHCGSDHGRDVEACAAQYARRSLGARRAGGPRPGPRAGGMLAIARISGETAPLLFTAFGSRFFPSSLNEPIASLTVQIYNYAISPYDEWHAQAWAATLVLMTLVLGINIIVRFLTRKRF